MNKVELLEEFQNIPEKEGGVLKANSVKSFLVEIYPPNDSFVNWLITTLSPIGGISIAILLPLIGINVATISAGGFLGFFGVTVLSGPILAPFIALAAAALTSGFIISRKFNKGKSSTASPEDLFSHQTLSLVYIPLVYFIRVGKLDRDIDYYENKVKEKFIKMGCTEKYIESFFSFVKKTTNEELLVLIEMITRVSAQLQKKAAFTGKLYKKDFKENYLFKLSKDICNSYNDEFCSDNSQISKNKIDIENLFISMRSFHKDEFEIQDRINDFKKEYDKKTANLEKNKNDEFNKELKSIKEELYSEFKEKEKEAIENLEAKRKSEIEALFKERNSSKDSEIEKYEEIIRKESLQTKK